MASNLFATARIAFVTVNLKCLIELLQQILLKLLHSKLNFSICFNVALGIGLKVVACIADFTHYLASPGFGTSPCSVFSARLAWSVTCSAPRISNSD